MGVKKRGGLKMTGDLKLGRNKKRRRLGSLKHRIWRRPIQERTISFSGVREMGERGTKEPSKRLGVFNDPGGSSSFGAIAGRSNKIEADQRRGPELLASRK